MRPHPEFSLSKTLLSPPQKLGFRSISRTSDSPTSASFPSPDLSRFVLRPFLCSLDTSIASESRAAISFAGSDPGISKHKRALQLLLQEQIMNGCEHFTIRDFVSEVRERDWRLTFPLPLPPGMMMPEQIKALLPPMESSQFKIWNCANGAGGQLSAVPSDVTRKDNFMADKIINVDTSAILPADDNTTDSDLLNTEKPKALLFDLNEIPTPEDSDEILENNEEAAATEELAIMDNTADQCHIANLAPVDEKHIGNTNETETSAAIRSIEADDSIEDDDIIPQTIRRRPVKYRALSELSSDQGKREECQNVDSNGTDHEMVPTPDPQPKKKIKLNKKKKKKSQHYSSWIQEKQGPEGCRAAPEKSNKKKRTSIDFNFLQAGASLQSPVAPCAKRKHQGSPDQNENSKGTAGTQKENGKKRRIFGDKVLKTSKDADQSSQVESGAIQRKRHKQLERVDHNLNAVVEQYGNSLPTQREEAASEEADQQMRSGAKQKKKNSSVSSGSASENRSDDKRLTVVVGKELVVRPNSTYIAKDVTMAAPQNETVNKLLPKNKRVIVDQALKEHGEADEICHNRPVSVQRVKLDSSSAIEKQSLNPVGENETESSTQTKRPAGKDTKGMLGAQPQKRNCSEKFKRKDLNQQMIVARQQKKFESDIRSRASKKRPPIVGRESPMALCNTPTVSPIHSREKALNGIRLLSIVATEHEELRAMSESDKKDIHALSDKVPPPSKSDIPALGYDGCVQVTVPTDYLLIDEEGDPFKLGPEDLPLRSHRLIITGSKKVLTVKNETQMTS